MKRTFDARHLNDVANHEDVRPGLGGQGPLDLTSVVGNPMNVCLANEHGGFVFHNHGQGLYEIHTLFLRSGRGKAVREALAFALQYMFVRTDCAEIATRIPQVNKPAAMLARDGGFSLKFHRAVGYEDKPTDYYALTLREWIQQTADCRKEGERFHDWLTCQKVVAGSPLAPHADDEIHDHYAGAACLMLKAGN